jgi:hypothetical protein
MVREIATHVAWHPKERREGESRMYEQLPLDESLDSKPSEDTANGHEKIDGVLYADGWDDCLLGHGNIFHGSDGQLTVAIYDRTQMVLKLAKEFMEDVEANPNNGMSAEENADRDFYAEADEYISFNVEGAYIQPGMPVYATIPLPEKK